MRLQVLTYTLNQLLRETFDEKDSPLKIKNGRTYVRYDSVSFTTSQDGNDVEVSFLWRGHKVMCFSSSYTSGKTVTINHIKGSAEILFRD